MFEQWRKDRAVRRTRREAVVQLYAAIVAQARKPRFYAEWEVPDTNDGRFEMIVLHAALVMRRLRGIPGDGPSLAQELSNLMFDDMDRSIREIGVGDLSVGKWVKRMAASFLARAGALDVALDKGDEPALTTVLQRNIWPGENASRPQPTKLARYLFDQDHVLQGQGDHAISGGDIRFASP
jgi:cytochrome b pre-mRNA-processing protein 3